MERSAYLHNVWEPYPSAPQGSDWIFGRFERRAGEFCLRRWVAGPGDGGSGEQALLLPIPMDLKILATRGEIATLPFFGLLRTGDWIGFRPASSAQEQNEIILLAPNLCPETQAPFQKQALTPFIFEFSQFRHELREFFRERGFVDLATPTLVECPGTEVFLDVFSTEFSTGSKTQAQTKTYFLPTSPEIHLKKVLALGAERIYELRPCFRNGELSDKHRPEFWMLEWYRAFTDLEALKKDCRELVSLAAGRADLKFSEVSVSELFEQLGFELRPDTSSETLREWCRRLGLPTQGYELWDDLFYLIFVDRIEAFLPSQQPLFVIDYPPSQAALARINPRGWADRFELYWRGFEIANAYFELNDPVEQKRRCLADLSQRQKLGRQELALDPGFFAALESGLPPSAGIALGVERLFMAARGLARIQDLSPFGFP